MHYTNILWKCYIVLLEQIKSIIHKHFWKGVNMKKNDKNKTDNFINDGFDQSSCDKSKNQSDNEIWQ